jgi:hypothetical protein
LADVFALVLNRHVAMLITLTTRPVMVVAPYRCSEIPLANHR